MNKIPLIFFLLFLSNISAQTNPFIRGVDISFTQQIEDLGGKYKVNGVAKDVLDIFKSNGVNYVRLRLWHTPTDGYCGLAKTIAFAKRVKTKGLKFLLDIHYSDSWADPGKQTKPAAWANISYSILKDSVYTYTKNVVTALSNAGASPDMIQIGNEISSGMLWPDGKNYTAEGWISLGELLKKGIQGVKDSPGGSQIKILLHINEGDGGNNNPVIWWFNNIITQNVSFDVIGLSYYPWWHGSLTQMSLNINDLANRYNKDIIIVETAYPMSSVWVDNTNNVGFDAADLPANYPVSVAGQKNFIIALARLIKDTQNKRGIGYFYWEPAYISVQPIGSAWDYYTTFNPLTGEALSSLSAFHDPDSLEVGVINFQNRLPEQFSLTQNFPNPFNPETVIGYQISAFSHVTLRVYDLLGREVVTLVDEFKQPGYYNSQFSILNSPNGSLRDQLSSGIYFCTLRAGSFIQTKKMILMK